MKILFLGNNWVGLKILEWLKNSDDEIVGLVIHPPERRKFADEMIAVSGLPDDRIFDAGKLREEKTLNKIRALGPEIGLSVYFGYILKSGLLELFPQGCLNLHPALLPFNRGSYPNVWSIIDGTPAGATLHYVDEKIDTGDIIAQREVETDYTDTGETLYRKLEIACFELFKDAWAEVKNGSLQRIPQEADAGTHYRVKDIEELDEIDLERNYKAKDLINLLRARTFPPYRGAFFRDGECKIYLELKLSEEKNRE